MVTIKQTSRPRLSEPGPENIRRVTVLTQQNPHDIVIVIAVVIFVVASLFCFLYLHPTKHDRWVPHIRFIEKNLGNIT